MTALADPPATALVWARRYLARGWSVVPLRGQHDPLECSKESVPTGHVCPPPHGRGSKRPRVGWKPYAERLPTEGEVEAWFSPTPDAGVAVVCGAVSAPPGLMLVCVDCDGPGVVEELERRGLPVSRCALSRTGRDGGGAHLYFLAPAVDFTRLHAHLGEVRIDVLGERSYAIMPPSIHPRTGRAHVWEHLPDELWRAGEDPLRLLRGLGLTLRSADCPICFPGADGAGEASGAGSVMRAAPFARLLTGPIVEHAGRDDAATRVAGYLVSRLDSERALDFLRLWNAAVCRPPLDDEDLVDKVRRFARESAPSPSNAGAGAQLASLVTQYVPAILGTLRDPRAARGILTGFPALDDITLGLLPGRFIVVGGTTGGRKTAFALNVALAAATVNYPVLYLSLEMRADRLLERLLGIWSGVDIGAVRRQRQAFTPEVEREITRAAQALAALPVSIIDDKNLPLARVVDHIVTYRQRDGIQLAIVDFLQEIEPDNPSLQAQRDVRVGTIARALADLAQKLGIAILAVSQLNRAPARENRPPMLADLRDSGVIEQRADLVLLVWTPTSQLLREVTVPAGEMPLCVTVAKHRDGPAGDSVLLMASRALRLREWGRIEFTERGGYA